MTNATLMASGVSGCALSITLGSKSVFDLLPWLPIKDAPKDELTPIVLWNGEKVTVGTRWESGFADWLHDWIEPQPTHFTALPPPPRAAA